MSDAAVGHQHQQQHLRAARCISGRQSGREGEADDVKSFKSFRSPLHDMWPSTLCIIHPVYFLTGQDTKLTGHHRCSPLPPPWLKLIQPWHKDYHYSMYERKNFNSLRKYLLLRLQELPFFSSEISTESLNRFNIFMPVLVLYNFIERIISISWNYQTHLQQ